MSCSLKQRKWSFLLVNKFTQGKWLVECLIQIKCSTNVCCYHSYFHFPGNASKTQRGDWLFWCYSVNNFLIYDLARGLSDHRAHVLGLNQLTLEHSPHWQFWFGLIISRRCSYPPLPSSKNWGRKIYLPITQPGSQPAIRPASHI